MLFQIRSLTRMRLFLWFLLAGMISAETRADEYNIKAESLVRFARYVEWPRAATLNLCVLGPDPFGDKLNGAAQGQAIGGRKLKVLRVAEPDGCNLLYISRKLGGGEIAKAARQAGKGVLTVSDAAGFTDLGGMIHFYTEGPNIRFAINRTAAQNAGVKISSQLLGLAKKLY